MVRISDTFILVVAVSPGDTDSVQIDIEQLPLAAL